jgi:hypothetical protein
LRLEPRFPVLGIGRIAKRFSNRNSTKPAGQSPPETKGLPVKVDPSGVLVAAGVARAARGGGYGEGGGADIKPLVNLFIPIGESPAVWLIRGRRSLKL